ncbi:(d)CMP kinase [Herbiconiux sp. CPCC 205716]|uniref:Cytidylate kinase n=1 Tax=Herbiconiux gentiana TaxID=2970912 RepID=A0ABT2GBQ6_9MICO|nr:(d)CMP kinase [Herbiconiux gentiana]MCS5713647.1 (d)CMP kinase [Herbiconiux gentiana]
MTGPTAEPPVTNSVDGNADVAVPVVVAIDGPAGSGKSSVSRAAARALGYAYLDTGASYRALAWNLLDTQVDPADPDAVIASLTDFDFAIGTDPEAYFVRVGSSDVTEAIREPRVTGAVSAVARIPEVRAWLTERFRSIMRDTEFDGIVAEGRDITTVVAPDAPVRILLTADEDARMARRSKELTGESAAAVGEALRTRDRADSRVVDFMNAAEGVTTVDSTHLDFDETVAAVVDVVHDQAARSNPTH